MNIARFEFQLFGINTYIVWDAPTGEAAIIDPGMSSSSEEQAIKVFLQRNNITLKALVNTHLHIDHVAGNKFIINNFGLSVMANKNDLPLGERVADQARMFGLDFEPTAVTISEFLTDGDVIKIGGSTLQVLHIPGHSPGGIALYDAGGEFVISGDSLFADSIGRTDLPGGNISQLINAVKSKLFALPDTTKVYPGHGEATTIGDERRYNPFLR